MPEITCDKKGRVLIPLKMRKSLGTKFLVKELNGKVVFTPYPRTDIDDRIGQ